MEVKESNIEQKKIKNTRGDTARQTVEGKSEAEEFSNKENQKQRNGVNKKQRKSETKEIKKNRRKTGKQSEPK